MAGEEGRGPMAIDSPIQERDQWFAGEDKDLVFDCSSGDTTAMAGWLVQFILSETPASDPFLTKDSTVSGEISIDASGKTVTVHIKHNDTVNLQGDVYWYQLFKANLGGWGMLAYGDAILQYH